jgi:D-serine deaminase-like pyridoxal phosphate-dependent protein
MKITEIEAPAVVVDLDVLEQNLERIAAYASKHDLSTPTIVFESMSEGHGQLDVSASETEISVGGKLSVIPNHVCACVNMHDRIWYHGNGVVQGSSQVAGRGKVL